MWKIKLQTQQYAAVVQAAQAARIEETKTKEEAKKAEKAGTRTIVDAYVVRGSKGAQLVRHMLVKDLRKAASVMQLELPVHGIFDDQGGQRALFALFDGQSSTEPAPLAAEMCCRHVLGKILRNLLSLPASSCTATYVKAAMLKTFEDLEKELVVAGCMERCGCSLALVVGDWLFTAVLGRCGAFFFSQAEAGKGYTVTSLCTQQATRAPVVPGQSFGTPEVRGTQMMNLEPFFILTSVPTTAAMTADEMNKIGSGYLRRPRATSGEISTRAADRIFGGDVESALGVDCASVVGFIKNPEELSVQPAAKRAKKDVAKELDSVRLRHILVKYKDLKQPSMDIVKGKPVTRTQYEAEVLLRETLSELLKDGDHAGDSAWAAKVSPRMISACRNTSECKTAMKGGSNCGDLGWLNKKELQKMGKEGFADAIFGLGVAEWSDVVFTVEGAHLMMRMA